MVLSGLLRVLPAGAVLLLIWGCAEENDWTPQLAAEIVRLRERVDSLSTEVRLRDYQLDEIRDRYSSADFDPVAEEGYGRIDANVGSFAVSIEGIEPYGDGVRVQLQIGNLSSATFNGGVLDVSWGPRRPSSEAGDTTYWPRVFAWREALRSETIRFTESLRPGAWNNVRIVLPATRPEEFGYLTVGIATDQISLSR